MRVLCFGDSNTYGFDPRGYCGGGYGAENRWPGLLKIKTGWDIINLGSNGREIPRSNHPLSLFTGYAPGDFFLVMLGTNDLLQGASAAEAVFRMESFLNMLHPYFHNIILVAPPPMERGAWVESDKLVTESIFLADGYEMLAEKLRISYVDTRNWNIDLCFDGVHFTAAGHRTFADRLAEQLT